MVSHDRFTDWDAHPRRSHDRRRSNTTSCAACANGWLVDHRRTDYPLSGNLQPRGQLTTALTKPPFSWINHLIRPLRSDGGIVRPRALAVLRLITSSNLVGCATGRSPGLAPFRILSTNPAARRNMS